jgi:CxxC motif-containing protein (DUF1111 family)
MRAGRSWCFLAVELSLIALYGIPTIAAEGRLQYGRELFERDWRFGDSRARGGDGLGPVYNARSCIGCHNQGGVGGGGPLDNNVDMLTVSGWRRLSPRAVDRPAITANFGRRERPEERRSRLDAEAKERARFEALFSRHPALEGSPSFVLHKFGRDPSYATWREEKFANPLAAGFAVRPMTRSTTIDGFLLTWTQRNTPALFGSGLIDAIPDEAVEAAAERRSPEFPEVSGRVSRTPDGRIGKFGWKGQTATLERFVMGACSVELGLEVPRHAQSMDPLHPKSSAPGFDLRQSDCDALVAYVRSLPAPQFATRRGLRQIEQTALGSELFQSIGCTACHTPSLGPVDGLFSDLLLHDMGQGLSAEGGYYGLSEPDPGSALIAGRPSEWRTPPLWGVRDSAPYLHDGRAKNLSEAILAHGGEAKKSANKFAKLGLQEWAWLTEFLRSLGAPRSNL